MAFVQSTVINGVSVSNLTSNAINTTSGDFIALGIGLNNPGTVTITDFINGVASGNTWTASTKNPQATGSGYQIYVFYSANINGGNTHTFKASFTTTPQWPSFEVHEYSGRALTSPLSDQQGATESSSGTSHTGPTVTAATGDDVVCFFAGDGTIAGYVYTAGSGFTIPTNGHYDDGSTSIITCSEYKANVSSGSVTAGLTTNQNTEAASIALSIKKATGIAFRKTLSGIGGKVGQRQLQ